MSMSLALWVIAAVPFVAAFLILARQIRVATSKGLSFEPARPVMPEAAAEVEEPAPAAIEQPSTVELPTAASRWSAPAAAWERGFESLSRENFARICADFGIRVISILPSTPRAEGEAEANLEILVEFGPDAKLNHTVVFQLRQELFAILGRQVDLISRNSAGLEAQQEIFAKARVLYAA
jgi:predicted nucleotidyltransferase